MSDIVIAGALRTAIGKFGGALAKVPAPELGATVIRALLAQSGVKPDQVSEVILGQVLTAGSGQNPARQALIKSGIPKEVPAMTINVVCGSGLKAVMLAAQAIRCGDADIVIAGGQENMSASPHVLPGSRDGFRMGDAKLVDTMIVDGLWDVYNQYHMGADRGERREEVRHLARAAGRVRGRSRRTRPRAAQKAGDVQGRDHAGDDSAAQGRSRRVRRRRVHQGRAPRSNRSRGLRPAFAKDGIGHGGQRLRHQRRRGRRARDDARNAPRSSASRRSRRSRRTPPRVSIRRSWAWARCRRRSGASRRPAGSLPISTSWRSTRRSRRRRAR